jgi:hypothetical protein
MPSSECEDACASPGLRDFTIFPDRLHRGQKWIWRRYRATPPCVDWARRPMIAVAPRESRSVRRECEGQSGSAADHVFASELRINDPHEKSAIGLD